MDMSSIINQMITLFLMMGVGYLCGKKDIIDPIFSKKMSNLIINVTTPAMIMASVSTKVSFPKASAIQVLLVSTVLFIVIIPLAYLAATALRVPIDDKKLYVFMFIFSNTGFMGYPVIRTIFGNDAVFLAALYNMIQGVALYSFGVWLMDSRGGKFNVKSLINPSMIASVLSLIVFLGDIPIPQIAANVFDSIGSITSPAAMLLIGSGLSVMPIKEIFTEIRLYPFAILKQIALPVVMYFLMGIFLKDATLLGIMTVVCAMPVANISVMFATQYGGNINMASKGVFITTMCSFITIPLLCTFLG